MDNITIMSPLKHSDLAKRFDSCFIPQASWVCSVRQEKEENFHLLCQYTFFFHEPCSFKEIIYKDLATKKSFEEE
jgi:hypothetical protein